MPQESSRDPGMLREQGQQAESKGSKLGFPEVPGRFQGSRDAQGVRGASWERGEQAGSKGSELGAF